MTSSWLARWKAPPTTSSAKIRTCRDLKDYQGIAIIGLEQFSEKLGLR